MQFGNRALAYLSNKLLLARITKDDPNPPNFVELEDVLKIANSSSSEADEVCQYCLGNLLNRTYGPGTHFRTLKVLHVIMEKGNVKAKLSALACKDALKSMQNYSPQGIGHHSLGASIRSLAASILEIMYSDIGSPKVEPSRHVNTHLSSQVYSPSPQRIQSPEVCSITRDNSAGEGLKKIAGRWGPQAALKQQTDTSGFMGDVAVSTSPIEMHYKTEETLPKGSVLISTTAPPVRSLPSNTPPASPRLPVEPQPVEKLVLSEDFIEKYSSRFATLCKPAGIKPTPSVVDVRRFFQLYQDPEHDICLPSAVQSIGVPSDWKHVVRTCAVLSTIFEECPNVLTTTVAKTTSIAIANWPRVPQTRIAINKLLDAVSKVASPTAHPSLLDDIVASKPQELSDLLTPAPVVVQPSGKNLLDQDNHESPTETSRTGLSLLD